MAEHEFINSELLNTGKLQSLKRLLSTLPNDEAEILAKKIKQGEKTGYATIDCPWENFYSSIRSNDLFLNTTPYQGLIDNNKNFLSEIAVHYFGANISFRKLIDNINKVSKSLEEYHVKKGDFVTICSTTTPEVIYIFYAISKIGAVANIMSPFYTPEELLSRIDECESKLIIIADKFLPKFEAAFSKDKSKQIVVLPIMNSSPLKLIYPKVKTNNKTNEIEYSTFLKCGANRKETQIDPYEALKPQAMVYSSGTTGASKGILLSVDSFQKLINAYGNSGFDTSRMQTVYQNIPPWHSTGLSLGINFPLSFGVKVCIDPRFDHDIFVKNVLKFKPEYILTNTSMYQGFTTERNLKRLKNKSLSFLKYPVEGGEPLTENDIKSIENVFSTHGSTARLLNGYGECECGATITTDITGHKFSNLASGIPLPKITTIGIFDDDFRELKYGERGNIVVKTDIGMLEYFKNPEATSEFFYIDTNGDRWSKTGDIGYLNEDGSLVVLGRKNDYSIINGTKIYNFDIERAVLLSKNVKLCEIQTHPQDDNVLIAHLVWSRNASAVLRQDPSKQNDFLRELQENVFKVLQKDDAVPRYFCIKESFPSAHSGKRDINYIKNDIVGLIELGE